MANPSTEGGQLQYRMRNLIRKFQTYWLADASFVTLLVMLIAAVFVLPVIMEISAHGVLLFNILLLSVFFSGIFSTRSVTLMSVSALLFCVHLALRIIRFGENPYSFFVLENIVAIANALVFIFINLRLLFRDEIVNAYRIVGAVNVYLLLALIGALALEVIHAVTGVSIGGNVVLSGTDDDYANFIYFSLASLTTVGFGDIYAVSTFSKMLATFLSTLGVLFPAIVIARLVGLASSRS
jgi:Ion channel